LNTEASIADRYTVEAVLGEGGMGAVFQVLDRRTDRRLALKRLRAAAGSTERLWSWRSPAWWRSRSMRIGPRSSHRSSPRRSPTCSRSAVMSMR
jgi:serine/threonine protein kinase